VVQLSIIGGTCHEEVGVFLVSPASRFIFAYCDFFEGPKLRLHGIDSGSPGVCWFYETRDVFCSVRRNSAFQIVFSDISFTLSITWWIVDVCLASLGFR